MNSEVGRGLGDSLHLHRRVVGSREVASQPQAHFREAVGGRRCTQA